MQHSAFESALTKAALTQPFASSRQLAEAQLMELLALRHVHTAHDAAARRVFPVSLEDCWRFWLTFALCTILKAPRRILTPQKNGGYWVLGTCSYSSFLRKWLGSTPKRTSTAANKARGARRRRAARVEGAREKRERVENVSEELGIIPYIYT